MRKKIDTLLKRNLLCALSLLLVVDPRKVDSKTKQSHALCHLAALFGAENPRAVF